VGGGQRLAIHQSPDSFATPRRSETERGGVGHADRPQIQTICVGSIAADELTSRPLDRDPMKDLIPLSPGGERKLVRVELTMSSIFKVLAPT
jgi:hypothetical protein